MTAQATSTSLPPAAEHAPRHGHSLRVMLWMQWRTSWRSLLLWPASLIALFVMTAVSLRALYPTDESVSQYAAAFTGDSAYALVNGTPYGLDTIAGVIAYEYGFIASIGLPLMGVLLVNRLTRVEEQAGRAELVRAGAVGRSSALTATSVLVGAALVLVGSCCALVMMVYEADAQSALLYGAGLTALGLFFAALSAALAQVVSHARAVTAVGVAALALAYLLRGVGDFTGSSITYLSPIGWTEQIRPFADSRLWPLVLSLVVSALLGSGAFVLVRHRDLGGGYIASSAGPARANRRQTSLVGFAIRRHAGATAGWLAGLVFVGFVFGLLSQDALEAVQHSDTLQGVVGEEAATSQAAAVSGYLYLSVLLLTLAACAFTAQAVGRLNDEERAGRLEVRLAAPVGRLPWLAANTAVITATAAVSLLAGATALGLSDARARDTWESFGSVVGAALAYLPGVLLVGSVALVAYGARPRTTSLGWLAVVWVSLVAFLGDAFRIPEWAQDLSPVHAVGNLPQDEPSTTALACIVVALVIAVGAAFVCFRRRDIPD